jgi:hypothetical protein
MGNLDSGVPKGGAGRTRRSNNSNADLRIKTESAGRGKPGESGKAGFPQLPNIRAAGISTGKALLYLFEMETDKRAR